MADSIGFKPTSVNVQGLTALIRNLGRDCTPEQFMREFVQNSIEACERTGLKNRRVLVDYNHNIQKYSKIFKICFTDNGDGMTLEQMNNLLNSISASGSSGNTYENYGVGAKISSLTRNHFGVQYESWRDGVGHSIIIRYNSKFDVFGIQGFPDDRGDISYHRPLSDAQKPDFIEAHGTRVTLFGNTLEQDTMAPPWGVGGDKGTWLYEYLNKRYFELPTGIAIDVRVGYEQDINNSQLHRLVRLVGFKDALLANTNHHGVVELKDAKVHWFLLNPESPVKGHSALLNQGEIFNVEANWSNRLTHFGILLGRDRVVIIIEPNEASQNIARTHLKKPDGSEFQWHVWQKEFRSNLPLEIQAYLESLLSQRNKDSSSKAIQKRLMSLHSLYTLSGFEPLVVQAPIQNLKVDVSTPLDALQDERAIDLIIPPEESEPARPETLEKPKVEPAKDAAQSEDEKESQENYFPRVEWTTEAQSPQLAGRAAEFVEYSNIILANQDFKGLQDIFKYFTGQYELSDERTKAVRNAILENAEQALMESVAGVLSLKSEPNWGGSYHQALTKEALSAVLMQRFWSVKAVEEGLGEVLRGIN
jgi:Histidine kinase-, DNA gyrase B-, and HSP90-like ATPase